MCELHGALPLYHVYQSDVSAQGGADEGSLSLRAGPFGRAASALSLAGVRLSTQRLTRWTVGRLECAPAPCSLTVGRAKCVARRHAPANAITEATNDITILGRTSTRSSGKQKSAQPSLRAHAIAYLRGSER